MARDALEKGERRPDGRWTYPNFPRHPVTGAPMWAPDPAYPNVGYVPRGRVKQNGVWIDLTPYDPETRQPIDVPTIAP